MSYLTDPRDDALFSATPILPAPRFGSLPVLNPGERRLLAAADGIYIEARTQALDLCWPVSDLPLPYGPMGARLLPSAGPVPRALIRTFIDAAKANPTKEIAAAICLTANGGGYEIIWPAVESASGSHITYRDDAIDDARLVIDMHSHGHHAARFSAQDAISDRSRAGPYIALVVGRCQTEVPELAARIAISPYLRAIDVPFLFANGVIE